MIAASGPLPWIAGIPVWGSVQTSKAEKPTTKSTVIESGGSFASWSVTLAATIVSVHASPGTNSLVGSSVKLVGPPLALAVRVPETLQASVNHAPLTFTGSLKVTVRLAPGGTSVAPSAGYVEVTSGAASGESQVGTACAPSPPNVSVAKPSQPWAASKASEPFGSPAHTVSWRRSVLSAVLTSPEPHSVPGSKPICPITSTTVVPLRSTTASSPLNQPDPFVWSACARIAAFAALWART